MQCPQLSIQVEKEKQLAYRGLKQLLFYHEELKFFQVYSYIHVALSISTGFYIVS